MFFLRARRVGAKRALRRFSNGIQKTPVRVPEYRPPLGAAYSACFTATRARTSQSTFQLARMDWERLDDDERPNRLSPMHCMQATLFTGIAGLLLFNAVGLARIQSDLEKRIAVSEAATNLRLTTMEHQIALLASGDPTRLAALQQTFTSASATAHSHASPPPPQLSLPPPRSSPHSRFGSGSQMSQAPSPSPPPPSPQPPSPPLPLPALPPRSPPPPSPSPPPPRDPAFEFQLFDSDGDQHVEQKDLILLIAIVLLLIAGCLCFCLCCAAAAYFASQSAGPAKRSPYEA